jgi:hypothetical protein
MGFASSSSTASCVYLSGAVRVELGIITESMLLLEALMSGEKVAVITAGESGMGAAIAKKLARDGYRIAVLSSSGKGEVPGNPSACLLAKNGASACRWGVMAKPGKSPPPLPSCCLTAQAILPARISGSMEALPALFDSAASGGARVTCTPRHAPSWTCITALEHGLVVASLKHLRAQTTSVVFGLEPVYGIALAWPIIGETPAIRTAIGGSIICSAVPWASFRQR